MTHDSIINRYGCAVVGKRVAIQKAILIKGVSMKMNEGKIDRIFRTVIGLGLLSLVYIGPQTPWGFVGLVPLLTGLFGFCPLYKVFGFDTCPMGTKK